MLYDQFSALMLGICRRYINTQEDAEDVLMDGYLKVFNHIGQLDKNEAVLGWMKRIMINECLMWLRKKRLDKVSLNDQWPIEDEDMNVSTFEMGTSELMQTLDSLPDGYRAVFNLYVIEEYKHREIAELLGISINTSKSQLILAKKKLKSIIEERKNIKQE